MSRKEPDYSWANYLDYMEGGGSDIVAYRATASPFRPVETKKEQPLWGVLAALGIALAALLLSELPLGSFIVAGRHPVEPVMLAIVLGMVVSNARPLPRALHAGIKFSVKKILPVGIVLLGARLDFFVMQRVGLAGLLLALVETLLAALLLLVLARVLRLPDKLATLLGVGTAICGGTAIVATAPVIEAEDEDVVISVAAVTLLGMFAMFALPIMAHGLALGQKAFGVWAGLAIHQTPQVVAAGFAYGEEAGDTATIVKLVRVCLLAPVVFVIGVVYARRKASTDRAASHKRSDYLQLFPLFVLGFIGMALLKTFGLLPQVTFEGGKLLAPGPHQFSVAALAEQVSKLCIVISMAGVGLETKFSAMKQAGLRPLAAAFIAMIVLSAVLLVLVRVFIP